MAVNRLPGEAAPGVWVVMQAGSLPAVFVAGGLALAARRPRLALGLVAGGTSAWALAKVVKQAVGRERPEALLHDVIVHGPAATGLGFPSGHAAVAAAIMTIASPYVTRPARIAGWVVVVLVAAARVYVGAHLPLDAAGRHLPRLGRRQRRLSGARRAGVAAPGRAGLAGRRAAGPARRPRASPCSGPPSTRQVHVSRGGCRPRRAPPMPCAESPDGPHDKEHPVSVRNGQQPRQSMQRRAGR